MAEFEANFTLDPQPEIEADFNIEVSGVTEHNLLSNRDLPDQHPIGAITGLQEALDTIPTDYVSDAELEAALLEKQDVIRDLSEIRQGAELGATAVQPSDLATVATSGSYNDLSNKPTIPTVPTNVSAFTNDAGYITLSALTPYATQNWVLQQGYLTEIPAEYVTNSELTAKGYQTAADVETAITAKGYTTMSAVEAKGYITNAALVGYATESYVDTGLNGKQDKLTQTQLDAVNSGANTTNIGQIATNTSGIADINTLIPNQATSSNQLADKDFVNSSINSMAAFYITSDVAGDPFATRAALIAGPYYFRGQLRTPTQNDYALVSEDETHDDLTSRYMYDGGQWVWQYTLNNTKFTQAQIDAINSGITDGLVAKISTNETAINNHIADKTNPHEVTKAQVGLSNVDNTSDLNKPISTATQTALNSKQDTISDLATIRSGAALGATAVQPSDLATVATSGSYNDLSNKPTIPAAQVNADWNATSGVAQILNKPTIPTVPTNVSAFTNDAGYITSSALNGYATETYVDNGLATKQATLVSGTNIKTVNGNSILGAGDLTTGKVLDYYGTCVTAASTRAKVVTCAGFVLETGASIRVKFSTAQTYNGAPTLNVNSTGAKTVKSASANAVRYCWNAGEVVSFTYDGSYWIMEDAGIASVSYYGYTMLASAEGTSSGLALTPAVLYQYNMNTVSGYYNYSTSSTYSVGDRVRYNFKNWECIEEITTPESWTQRHWRALPTLQAQIDGKQDAITSSNKLSASLVSGLATVATSGSYDDLINKPTIPTATSDLTNDSGFITNSALSGYEQTSNKVTSISSSSTDTEYPSAKCVYDIVGDIETALHTINSGGINAGGSGGSTN